MQHGKGYSMSDVPLEETVLGFFDPQAISIHIPRVLPEEVRTGALNIGQLVIKDLRWGMVFIHEFVHHLQTTTTLSGIRLFHYYWTNRINLLSSLDHEVLELISRGQTLCQALSEYRQKNTYMDSAIKRYDLDFKRYKYFNGITCHRNKHSHSVPHNTVRVSVCMEPFQYPGLAELSVPILKVKIDYPDGNREETILGARRIKEGAARAIEIMFIESYFQQQHSTAKQRMFRESLSSNPKVTMYYTAFNLFFSHVKKQRFQDVRVFAIICELALMYDVVLSEYDTRFDKHGKLKSFSSKQDMFNYWRRDVGQGIVFFHLIQLLNEKHKEIPSFNKESDGEELYCTLAKLANIPISRDSLTNASHFVESSNFLFSDPDWGIFFNYARERIRVGLGTRMQWHTKPLLSFILSNDMKCLVDIMNTPTLVCYENTITAPTKSVDELAPLLFKELVDNLLRRGRAECMLRSKYPQLCNKSNKCSQGAYRRVPLDLPKPEFWCPYIKGVLLVQEWFSSEDKAGEN